MVRGGHCRKVAISVGSTGYSLLLFLCEEINEPLTSITLNGLQVAHFQIFSYFLRIFSAKQTSIWQTLFNEPTTRKVPKVSA